jgi:glucosamine--fructose-6-phosphate aminotransferase (isomerizing)
MAQVASFVAEKKGCQSVAEQLRTGLKETPAALEAALAQQDKIAAAARQMGADGARIFFTGPGPSGVTAVEGALKCKEAAYVTAEGAPLETFLHGPIVSLGPGDHLVMLNTFAEGAAASRTADIARAVGQIGVKVWLVGQQPDGTTGVPWITLGTPGGNEVCANLAQVVVLQLLACFLADVRGTNPDSFRYDVADYKAAISAITL